MEKFKLLDFLKKRNNFNASISEYIDNDKQIKKKKKKNNSKASFL